VYWEGETGSRRGREEREKYKTCLFSWGEGEREEKKRKKYTAWSRTEACTCWLRGIPREYSPEGRVQGEYLWREKKQGSERRREKRKYVYSPGEKIQNMFIPWGEREKKEKTYTT
jgi:hypothetical protein